MILVYTGQNIYACPCYDSALDMNYMYTGYW